METREKTEKTAKTEKTENRRGFKKKTEQYLVAQKWASEAGHEEVVTGGSECYAKDVRFQTSEKIPSKCIVRLAVLGRKLGRKKNVHNVSRFPSGLFSDFSLAQLRS